VTALVAASTALYLASALAGGAVLLGRFAVLLLFALHLAAVLCLRDRSPRTVGAFAVLLAVLAVPELGAAVRRLGPVADVRARVTVGTHTHAARRDHLDALLPGARPGDVVLAPVDVSWWLPALTGTRVVAAAHADPFMDDYRARRSEVDRFFERPGETPWKRAVLERRDARFVVVPERAWAYVGPALAGWPVVARADGYRTVRRPAPVSGRAVGSHTLNAVP
jgi:hypothetical protein